MGRICCRRSCWLTAALLVAAPGSAQAQTSSPRTGRVEGSVFDSIGGEPLRGATVFLIGTTYRADTGPDGTFLLDSVPAGPHTAVFYHDRLQEIGLSPGPRTLTVRAGETAYVSLAIPAVPTLLAAQCAFEAGPVTGSGGRVALVGRVTDGGTGVPLPQARVEVSWREARRDRDSTRTLATDESGWYRTCAVPVGVPLTARASFVGRFSRQEAVVLEAGHPGRADFVVGALEGAALDVASGTPLQGVDTAAIPLPPLEVIVGAQPPGGRAMGGFLVSRAAIERVKGRANDLADVLREQHVSGLIVRRDGPDACIGFMPGQVRMSGRTGCTPLVVFINGARTSDPYMAFSLPVDMIDRMVLFRPVEAGNLFGLGSADGVLQVFTRNR